MTLLHTDLTFLLLVLLRNTSVEITGLCAPLKKHLHLMRTSSCYCRYCTLSSSGGCETTNSVRDRIKDSQKCLHGRLTVDYSTVFDCQLISEKKTHHRAEGDILKFLLISGEKKKGRKGFLSVICFPK